MVNFCQTSLTVSTLLAMTSYVSAFWWAAQEPAKPTGARATSSSSNFPQTSFQQGSYPGGGSFAAISQGGYPANAGFAVGSSPSGGYSSQATWAGASWPPARPLPFYDYSQHVPSFSNMPYLPLQVPLQGGFGQAHIQNVQLVPCLCPVTTEYGYDTSGGQTPAQPIPLAPAQNADGDGRTHGRKMYGRSQQVVPPIVKETNAEDASR